MQLADVTLECTKNIFTNTSILENIFINTTTKIYSFLRVYMLLKSMRGLLTIYEYNTSIRIKNRLVRMLEKINSLRRGLLPFGLSITINSFQKRSCSSTSITDPLLMFSSRFHHVILANSLVIK